MFAVLRFDAPSSWEPKELATSRNWRDAVWLGDKWLDDEDQHSGHAAVAVVDLRPGYTGVDYRAIGFAPLDLSERIDRAAEECRRRHGVAE